MRRLESLAAARNPLPHPGREAKTMTSPALPIQHKPTLTIEHKPTLTTALVQNWRRLVAQLATVDLSYQDSWERKRR